MANVLLLELICSNLDGNALEDAFRAKNISVLPDTHITHITHPPRDMHTPRQRSRTK